MTNSMEISEYLTEDTDLVWTHIHKYKDPYWKVFIGCFAPLGGWCQIESLVFFSIGPNNQLSKDHIEIHSHTCDMKLEYHGKPSSQCIRVYYHIVMKITSIVKLFILFQFQNQDLCSTWKSSPTLLMHWKYKLKRN